MQSWEVGTLGVGEIRTLTLETCVVGSGNITIQVTEVTGLVAGSETTKIYDPDLRQNQASTSIQVPPAADLELALLSPTAAQTSNVGDTLDVVVQLTNRGPDAVQNVLVSLPVPALLGIYTPTLGAGTVYTKSEGRWLVPNLAAGASTTLVINPKLKNSGSFVLNGEVLSSSLFDPDSLPNNGLGRGEDDEFRLSKTIAKAADLDVSITTSKSKYAVGELVSYQIQVTNRGPDLATNIAVSNTLPGLLHFESGFTRATAGVHDINLGAWSGFTLTTGSSASLFLVGTITLTNEAAGQAITTGIIKAASNQYDPNLGNNTPARTINVFGADLAVEMSVSNAHPTIDQVITYAVTVTNGGPDLASRVVLTDLLPTALEQFTATTKAGSVTLQSGRIHWEIGDMAASGTSRTATLALTGTVKSTAIGQVITNTVTGLRALAPPDPVYNNNTVAMGVSVQKADLTLLKVFSQNDLQEGDGLVYNVQVTNNGPDVATHLVIEDLLPGYLSLVGNVPSIGTYEFVDGDPTMDRVGIWRIDRLNVGQSTNLLIITGAGSGSGGRILYPSLKSVQSDQQGYTQLPPERVRTIKIVGADLTLEKAVSNRAPNVGSTVNFTLTLGNPGPFDAGEIVVTDTLPTGITVQGSPLASLGNATLNGREITWRLDGLSIGGSATLRLAATINAGTGSITQTNAAQITSAMQASRQDSSRTLPDPGADNNSAVASLIPQSADLRLTLNDLPDPVVAGETLLYTVTVENAGPTDAAGVNVITNLPTGALFLAATAGCTNVNRTITCLHSQPLPVGISTRYTITARYLNVATVTVNATVSATTIDEATANNSASTSTAVKSAAASRLVLTGPATALAGQARALTLTAYDPFGNVAADYTATKVITFAGASNAPAGTPPTVSNSAGTAIAFGQPVTLTFNAGIANVSAGNNGVMRLYRADATTVTASDGAISTSGADGLSITVTPAAASKLVFTSSAYTGLEAGVSSGVMTVQRRDAFDNPNSADAALTVNLTSNGSGVYAFRNSADTATLTSITIAQGSHSASFRYRDEKVGSPTLTAAATGLTATTQQQTVVPAALDHFAVGAIGTQTAGTPFTVTLTAQDAFNNTVTGFTGTASLSTTAGSITPLHHGQLQQRYTHRKRHADHSGQWAHLIATSGSATGTSTGFTVNPGRATALTLTRQPTTIVANGTSTSIITATLRDANSNLTPGRTVNLHHHSGDLCQHRHNQPHRHYGQQRRGDRDAEIKHGCAHHRHGECSGPERQRQHHGHVCGGHGHKFKLTLSGGTNAITPTVTAGVPIRLRVTAQDANSNTATTYDNTVSITSNAFAGTVNATISSGGLVNNITITPTVSGSAVLTVTDGTITTANAANAFTVNPAALDHFDIDSIGTQTAGVAFPVTITARDAFGNRRTSFTGSVFLSAENDSFFESTTFLPEDNGRKTVNATLTSAGSNRSITVTGGGKSSSSNKFTVNPATLDHFEIDFIGTQTAGTAFAITLRAQRPLR